jgi:hypothetical protein
MSVNNVLNRPMFREVALRKGYLKPKKARVGQFIRGSGFSMNPIATQNVRNVNTRNLPMVVEQPGMFSRTGQFFKRLGRDVKNFPGSLPGQLKNPKTRVPFGFGGGIARTLIAPAGTYAAVSALTDKLGMQPGMLKSGVDLGLSGLALINPYTRAAGLALGAYNLARPIVGGAIDYVTQKPMGTTSQALNLTNYLGDPLKTNIFSPIDPSKRETRKERRDRKKLEALAKAEGSEGQISTTPPLNVAKAEGEQNVKGTDSINVAEIKNKAIEKSTGIDGGLKGPVGAEPGAAMGPIIEGTIASKPEAPIKEPKKDTLGVSDIKKDTPFAQQIALAREIKAELMKGRDPGLARRTFLLNLAAGLMSGTTKKQGLAGAVDVFGQALGPASNNYATLKLKESELENNLMSEALEMATEQFKAANDIELLEGDSGVVQIMGADGKLRNIAGKSLKDGSVQIAIPGALTQQGTQAFQTVPYGGYVRFIKREKANELQGKVLKDISGAYKGYAFNKINLQILEQAQRDSKQLAGPRGKINLLFSRLGGAASDFGFSIGSNKADLNNFFTKDFLTEENIKSYAEDRNITTEFAENELKRQMEEIYKDRQTQLKAFISPVGTDDSQDLERLAINETITVYALANALKSKDRLTQKDIQNARELVNIFPIGKGQVQVIQSLRAINETLIKDIERLENDFTNQAFGDYIVLEQYRNKYGLSLGETEAPAGTTMDKPTNELIEDFDK